MSKTIQLTKGKVAEVDDGDFDRASIARWQAEKHRNTWYAVRVMARAYDEIARELHGEFAKLNFP